MEKVDVCVPGELGGENKDMKNSKPPAPIIAVFSPSFHKKRGRKQKRAATSYQWCYAVTSLGKSARLIMSSPFLFVAYIIASPALAIISTSSGASFS